ncbi:MAG: 3-deoxy-manno-octulosonate cytidylyltransferase [Gemmatimonadota bacterium]|nr:3-deoxy-manno-octulosonate cytidylyltransferase [Gemmatimonadota bacterium]
MSGRVLGVVPARLASTRLPEKPLYPILGRPLIDWVWRRVATMRVFDDLVVATDSERIVDACRRIGAAVVLTSPSHESGTDRVAEVAARPEYRSFTHIVNVQGDEPLIDEETISAAVSLVIADGWDVGTCATTIGEPHAYRDPAVVKVVRARDGRALYFSRAPVPHARDGAPDPPRLAREPFFRHVGIYSYTREALEGWVAAEPSPLERIERLEQLRALEYGIRIGVAVVERAAPGVDTPDDVVRLERHLNRQGTSTFA